MNPPFPSQKNIVPRALPVQSGPQHPAGGGGGGGGGDTGGSSVAGRTRGGRFRGGFTGGFGDRWRGMSLLLMMSLFAVGCGPAEQTRRDRAKQVGWVELVNQYRDSRDDADREYLDKPVQVYLPRMSYRADQGRIETYFGMPHRPACLVFRVRHDVSGRSACLVTGTCRGTVYDGVERANGIRWYVLVEDCVVTELD